MRVTFRVGPGSELSTAEPLVRHTDNGNVMTAPGAIIRVDQYGNGRAVYLETASCSVTFQPDEWDWLLHLVARGIGDKGV